MGNQHELCFISIDGQMIVTDPVVCYRPSRSLGSHQSGIRRHHKAQKLV